jgi:hypothetical protein
MFFETKTKDELIEELDNDAMPNFFVCGEGSFKLEE